MNETATATTNRRVTGAIALLLGVLAAALFAPALFGDSWFFPLHTRQMQPWRSDQDTAALERLEASDSPVTTDKNFLFHPDTAWMVDCWKRGEWPLWNPWILGGVSQIGQALIGCYYPPNLLYLCVEPLEGAYAWVAAFHVWWAALGAFLLLRALRLGRGVALFGAVAFALSGPLALRYHYFMTFYPVAWLPWLWWVVHRYTERPNLVRGLLVPLPIVAIVLTGFPQTGVYGIHLAALYGVARTLWLHRRGALRPLLGLLGGLAFAFPLVAAQVLPVLETQQTSLSRERSAQLQIERAGSPWLPAGYLLVEPFFDPDEPLTQDWVTNPLWSALYCRVDPPDEASAETLPRPRLLPRPNPTEDVCYAGALALMLAGCGLAFRRRRGLAVGCLVVLVYGWCTALGLPPLIRLAHAALPGADMGDVRRILPTLALPLAVLAALGLEGLTEGPSRRRARWTFGLLAAVCVAVTGGLVLLLLRTDAAELWRLMAERIEARTGRQIPDHEPAAEAVHASLSGESLRALLACVVALGAGYVALIRKNRVLGIAVCTAVLVTDLALVHLRFNPFVPREGFLESHPFLERVAARAEEGRVHRLLDRAGETDLLRRVALPPNLGIHYGIADAEGYIVAVPERWARFHRALQPDPDVVETVLVRPLCPGPDGRPAALTSALADIAGIQVLLCGGALDPSQIAPGRWRLLAEHETLRAYENVRARPMVAMFAEAEWVGPSERDHARVLAAAADAEIAVQRLHLERGGQGSGSPPKDPNGSLRRVEGGSEVVSHQFDGHALTVDFAPGNGGFLFFGQGYDAGWRAHIDGEPTVVHPADVAFCGVEIPPGSQRLTLRFRPRSATLGAGISLSALALWLVVLALALYRARRGRIVEERHAFGGNPSS